MAPKRLAMVTIGQAPRSDMVPDLRACVRDAEVEMVEFGALDGVDDTEIEDLAPEDGQPRLVSRLRDGREVAVDKAQIEARLRRLLTRLDAMGFDAIVVLCTGHFEGMALRTPLIESQIVVDEAVAALAGSIGDLGILLPHREQIDAFHPIAAAGRRLRFSHASPYGDMRFAEAGCELSDADLIVMHCMGYSEAMRREVAEASGRPVLLARQIVGDAIREFAEPQNSEPQNAGPERVGA